MKHLQNRVVFETISRNDLTEQENKRAMESLILLVQNRSGKIKARNVANGSPKIAYIDRDDGAIPTETSNAFIITGGIEAKQGIYVTLNYVPNSYVQLTVPQDK